MTNKVLHWNTTEYCNSKIHSMSCDCKGYWMALEDMTDKAIREDHDPKSCPECNKGEF